MTEKSHVFLFAEESWPKETSGDIFRVFAPEFLHVSRAWLAFCIISMLFVTTRSFDDTELWTIFVSGLAILLLAAIDITASYVSQLIGEKPKERGALVNFADSLGFTAATLFVCATTGQGSIAPIIALSTCHMLHRVRMFADWRCPVTVAEPVWKVVPDQAFWVFGIVFSIINGISLGWVYSHIILFVVSLLLVGEVIYSITTSTATGSTAERITPEVITVVVMVVRNALVSLGAITLLMHHVPNGPWPFIFSLSAVAAVEALDLDAMKTHEKYAIFRPTDVMFGVLILAMVGGGLYQGYSQATEFWSDVPTPLMAIPGLFAIGWGVFILMPVISKKRPTLNGI